MIAREVSETIPLDKFNIPGASDVECFKEGIKITRRQLVANPVAIVAAAMTETMEPQMKLLTRQCFSEEASRKRNKEQMQEAKAQKQKQTSLDPEARRTLDSVTKRVLS